MGELKTYNVCFIGRTGNGKSSLINSIWNPGFATDSLVSCTKQLISSIVMDSSIPGYDAVCVYDTPGIGEFSSDSVYERFYEHAVSVADCVVLVTTFDRTDAPAQRLLMRLNRFLRKDKEVKFVIALNHIDSRIITDMNNDYNPWNVDENVPTEQCMRYIEERKSIIMDRYTGKFLPFDIVPVCAVHSYGVENLKNIIYKN